MRNVEIKASIKDWSRVNQVAKELNNSEPTLIEQNDVFFKVQKGRLKLRRFKDGSGELLFYERPDVSGPKLCDYKKVNLNLEECVGMDELLAESNGILGRVKKERYLYMVGQSRVHLDRVENLGEFVEIEVVLRDDQSIQEGEEIANRLMEKLGIEVNDLIPQAYMDLLLAET